ncbi:MAG: LytR/AlgR family response regulator transcription factor [Bacteroidia bacterium]
MITAIIVDDEEPGRNVLKSLIKKHFPEIAIRGEAASVKEAKKVIAEELPSLVFLDIEMPGGSGFDLLEQIEDPPFSVIFTSAYNQYAVKAFKYSALDYLLKPINPDELANAVKKILSPEHKKDMHSALRHFMESFNYNGISKSNKVALPTMDGLVFIDIADIVRCEADGKYTYCHISGSKKLYSTRSLMDFEEQLSPHGFCRIHHAHLVNLNHIRNYVKGLGGYVVMSNGDNVIVSKRKKENFIRQSKKI